MHNMSSQRTWDKMNMENEDYTENSNVLTVSTGDVTFTAEEHYFDVEDTYVATVKNLKRKNCCVCNGYYERELTKKDKDYLAQVREEYDIKFHPDVNIDEFHAGIKIK